MISNYFNRISLINIYLILQKLIIITLKFKDFRLVIQLKFLISFILFFARTKSVTVVTFSKFSIS